MDDRALRAADANGRAEERPIPADLDLPATPSLESGLAPTETVTRRIDAGPLTAIHYQQFADLPHQHAATTSLGESGPRVVATLANGSDESWAYRVPRGPAPFAGGRASADGTDAELRAAPVDESDGFGDGVLRPGESVRTTVSISALTGGEPGWPDGEFTFLQPVSVWADDAAYSYNWQVTLIV
ncbi:hypothetical protein B4589_014655 [Halolamina sp. CBA1230]|uniref:hypothetical protein n=1 Tax=Halolamina sp. CBA1230 TaxID=1853690 RepID=UPI0009A1C488|nr:hypothetical protein [Halolamina sp. CBA1230]QKY21553.1 hypothetical protein B4589_014655 [Halolamina sp. CBA1230]